MQILKAYDIDLLVDIRHYPGSRYCPQFNKGRLSANLKRNKINYIHLESLGGRRRADKTSQKNLGWRNLNFRGYADHMQSMEFKRALKELRELTKNHTVVIMCSEAVPWRCHRSMVGDALVVHGYEVMDIFTKTNSRTHKLTSFAEVRGKKITYPAEDETLAG